MNKEFIKALDILTSVYKGGEYASIALDNAAGDKDVNFRLITKLVYGVLERDIELGYYISQLAKPPSGSQSIIVKIGLYALIYIDSMQDYAVVDSSVELCNYIKKPQLKGFVNALLNRYINERDTIKLPRNKFDVLSVKYSTPLWLVKAYFKQYGEEIALKIMSTDTDGQEHIRANHKILNNSELEESLDAINIPYTRSPYDGYYITNAKDIRILFDEGLITIQSPSSMIGCKALGIKSGEAVSVLDLCAAPGGKSLYISELNPSATITACDIHEHRVGLMNKYIKRMGATNITTELADGRTIDTRYNQAFDYVLCDAPCSGLGVAYRKPDILLRASMETCIELHELQFSLLNSAINCTKIGGYTIYSTCTTLREENMNVIGRMLKSRDDIVLEVIPIDMDNDGTVQLLPGDGLDGFFIARIKRIR